MIRSLQKIIEEIDDPNDISYLYCKINETPLPIEVVKETTFLFSRNTHKRVIHLTRTHKNGELVKVIGALDSVERQKKTHAIEDAINSMSSVSAFIRTSSWSIEHVYVKPVSIPAILSNGIVGVHSSKEESNMSTGCRPSRLSLLGHAIVKEMTEQLKTSSSVSSLMYFKILPIQIRHRCSVPLLCDPALSNSIIAKCDKLSLVVHTGISCI